jgi:hypothetical protein
VTTLSFERSGALRVPMGLDLGHAAPAQARPAPPVREDRANFLSCSLRSLNIAQGRHQWGSTFGSGGGDHFLLMTSLGIWDFGVNALIPYRREWKRLCAVPGDARLNRLIPQSPDNAFGAARSMPSRS